MPSSEYKHAFLLLTGINEDVECAMVFIWIEHDSTSNQNDCFNINDSGNLEIANCINSEKWNYIGLTGQVQATKPIGGKNKCLTLKHTPESGVDNQYNILLDDCTIGGPEQAWNFI